MQPNRESSIENSTRGWNSSSTLLSVPIYATPPRSGFGPQLPICYDGSGNGPFGFGWSLALQAVTRQTDKGFPQYEDAIESDIFIVAGGGELKPSLVETRSVYGRRYSIHRYRPPAEGLFERWVNLSDPGDTFWRSISKDNVTSWYGKTPESRIADPEDPNRVFSWLISESYDDQGNLILYEYKPEDSENVNLTQANERNRTPLARSANRYIKRIFYGNRVPYLPDLTAAAEPSLPIDWCFELVFDYGEHTLEKPVPQETGIRWTCRRDPFSSHRSTFEVRTYRLCRRALMFHHFPADENIGLDCLVRSTDLTHAPFIPSLDPSRPFYSYLLSAKQISYSRDGSSSLPPLEFRYTEVTVDETVRETDADGIDRSPYRWVDLKSEGLSGVLAENAGSWFCKGEASLERNPTVKLKSLPVLDWRNPDLKFVELTGDGCTDLLIREGDAFRWYKSISTLGFDEQRVPKLLFSDGAESIFLADLTGDGLTDLVRIREGEICYWPNRGYGRFGAKVTMDHAPWFDRSDLFDARRIQLIDIDGSGTADIVYFAANWVRLYFNQSGNGWSAAKVLRHVPPVDTISSATAADFLGNGTACLVWSSAQQPMRYVDLMGEQKPHRLVQEPAVQYKVAATA
jgi:hypothetical protein